MLRRMPEPDASHLELATLIRGALVLSDRLKLRDVSIGLDVALNKLAARDSSGTIQPVRYDLDDYLLEADPTAGIDREARSA
jgi:hypothetical protein